VKIETPALERLLVIQAVMSGKRSEREITESESAWMQEKAMEVYVNQLAQTNAMAFSEVEDGMLN